MGRIWDDFKRRVGEKTADVGTIIIDLAILLVLAALMVLADQGRERIFGYLGTGNFFTKITLVVVEILLDLSAIVHPVRWLVEEIRRIFT
jgi:hypothetical protein